MAKLATPIGHGQVGHPKWPWPSWPPLLAMAKLATPIGHGQVGHPKWRGQVGHPKWHGQVGHPCRQLAFVGYRRRSWLPRTSVSAPMGSSALPTHEHTYIVMRNTLNPTRTHLKGRPIQG